MPLRAVASTLAALLLSTQVMAATPIERGIAAVDAERFQDAIAILTQALDGRELKSTAEVGLAYWHLCGAPAIATATEFLRSADTR